MPIYQRVAALEQVRVLRVLLDHVTQLAEVMHQQPQASLVLIRLQRLEQIRDEVLELGLLDLERDFQCLLEREPGLRAIFEFRVKLGAAA